MANEINPSVALQELVDAHVKGGMDRRAATERVFRAYPQVAAAHHRGEMIERLASSPPARPRLPPGSGPGRRVRAHEMIPGRTYLHRCSDEASGGGIFELAVAA